MSKNEILKNSMTAVQERVEAVQQPAAEEAKHLRGIAEETADLVCAFRDERNWKQFHNPKDLAVSISLEAAELLEVFQWSGEDLKCEGKLDKIREELADVANYCVLMADACGISLDEIIRAKVNRNGEKYPVEKAYGKKDKYTELK